MAVQVIYPESIVPLRASPYAKFKRALSNDESRNYLTK
jgi:hypothetical protein